MKKIILFVTIFLFIVPLLVFAEQKATLYFLPTENTYSVGQDISLSVIADPHNLTFDTVKAVINFSTDTLEVKNIVLNLKFSVTDPDNTHSNTNGTISYGAGVPGGIATLSQFAMITFFAKKEGKATVSFDPQSIILSAGENIISGAGQSMVFTINQPTVLQPTNQDSTKPIEVLKIQEIKPSNATTPTTVKNAGKDDTNKASPNLASIPIVGQTSPRIFQLLLNYLKLTWTILSGLLLLVLVLSYFYRKRIFSFFLKIFKIKESQIQ